MKNCYISLIALALSIMSCNSQQTKTAAQLKPVFTDSAFHGLKIGGCYTVPVSKDTMAGLILSGIRIEGEELTYIFFMSVGTFVKKPTAIDFERAGIWSKKIPTSMDGKTWQLAFPEVMMSEQNMTKEVSKLSLIKLEGISKMNRSAGSGAITSFSELPIHYNLFALENRRLKVEKQPIPQFPYESAAWSSLKIANDLSELPQPELVWRLTRKTAHPKAAALMNEDWYWNEADDFAPFGNDDGWDALYRFKEWREEHPDADAAECIGEFEEYWGISFSHKNIVDESALPALEKKNRLYRNVDRAIIAIAAAQAAMEGRLSPTLKQYALNAIRRTQAPYTLTGMTEVNKKEYLEKLEKMRSFFNHF